jgi:hypothetical protein
MSNEFITCTQSYAISRCEKIARILYMLNLPTLPSNTKYETDNVYNDLFFICDIRKPI